MTVARMQGGHHARGEERTVVEEEWPRATKTAGRGA